MASRIIEMRKQLYDALLKRGTPGSWDHINKQIGMFSFTGMNGLSTRLFIVIGFVEKQVRHLVQHFHVYLTSNGRISMAGLNSHNIEYFAGICGDNLYARLILLLHFRRHGSSSKSISPIDFRS